MNRLTIFALALASANAAGLTKRQDSDADISSELDDYLSDVCEPADQSGNRDWSAPCNAVISIQYECMYGAAGAKFIHSPAQENDAQHGDDEDKLPEQPDEAQRICFCQSQFRDQIVGCMKCHKAHGGVEGSDWFSESLIDPAVKEYCNASKPADQSFGDFFLDHVPLDNGTTTESAAAQTSTFSDPIFNKTDVSLYFTPSVTGTPAYVAAMPTAESSGGNVTYTSSMTSDGQIVPTAVGNEAKESSGTSESSGGSQSSGSAQSGAATASSDAGAVQTAMAHSGTLGALGLAALIAVL